MNPLFLAFTLAGAVSVDAENRVLKTLSVKPTRLVEGPLVSVIIPAYNEERYLPALLQALENQTYRPIEVIVVDNMSEDNTVNVASNYGAKVITNNEAGNVNRSRNIGASESKGTYLVFIDADTIPESNAIEKTVIALQSGADLVYTNKCSTDDHLISLWRVAAGWIDIFNFTATGCYLAIRREVFESVNGFDETLNPMTGFREDGKTFTNSLIGLGYNVDMLRNTYVGTSARRFQKEGALKSSLWKERSIRGIGQRQYETVQQLL